MEASIQNLTKELKTVVFEKDELEFRHRSELKAFLPLLAYQGANSDVEKQTSLFRYEAMCVKTRSTFWQFKLIRIPHKGTKSTIFQSNILTKVKSFRLRP